jgi:hypothetical protein
MLGVTLKVSRQKAMPNVTAAVPADGLTALQVCRSTSNNLQPTGVGRKTRPTISIPFCGAVLWMREENFA